MRRRVVGHRTRKHLIPACESGTGALGVHRDLRARHRMRPIVRRLHQRQHGVRHQRGAHRILVGRFEHRQHRLQRLVAARRGPSHVRQALAQFEPDRHARFVLGAELVPERRPRILPGLDPVEMQAARLQRERRGPAVVGQQPHPRLLPGRVAGSLPLQRGREHVVPVADHVDLDVDDLAGDPLDREQPAIDGGRRRLQRQPRPVPGAHRRVGVQRQRRPVGQPAGPIGHQHARRQRDRLPGDQLSRYRGVCLAHIQRRERRERAADRRQHRRRVERGGTLRIGVQQQQRRFFAEAGIVLRRPQHRHHRLSGCGQQPGGAESGGLAGDLAQRRERRRRGRAVRHDPADSERRGDTEPASETGRRRHIERGQHRRHRAQHRQFVREPVLSPVPPWQRALHQIQTDAAQRPDLLPGQPGGVGDQGRVRRRCAQRRQQRPEQTARDMLQALQPGAGDGVRARKPAQHAAPAGADRGRVRLRPQHRLRDGLDVAVTRIERRGRRRRRKQVGPGHRGGAGGGDAVQQQVDQHRDRRFRQGRRGVAQQAMHALVRDRIAHDRRVEQRGVGVAQGGVEPGGQGGQKAGRPWRGPGLRRDRAHAGKRAGSVLLARLDHVH